MTEILLTLDYYGNRVIQLNNFCICDYELHLFSTTS